ncbi:MAG TPA: glucose-6-phosphate isomerase [Archaeoglobus veneficus]|nr:glucose-6-phosphate isomerase [Archaeoglobus veneficus]
MELEIAGRKFQADVRNANDLLPVLAYPNELKENFPAYFMFRDVFYSEKDLEKIKKYNLRYDVTIIPPNKIGKEFIKTYGHYHPEAEFNLSYPEIYEVLEGEAFFVIQRRENSSIDIINDFIAIKAEKHDKIIIPPNYGHVTINPSEKELKMSNWVFRDFSSIYEPYAKMRGACYYYTTDGWIKNENYKSIPEIRFAKPNYDFLIEKDVEMYELVKNIEKLEFLWKPSKYAEMFKKVFQFLD